MAAATAARVRARLALGARRLLRDYRLNWIYASSASLSPPVLPDGVELRRLSEADETRLAASGDAELCKALGYQRDGADGFLLARAGSGDPLAVAHFVYPDRYRDAAIWPLGADRCALVNIVVPAAERGRGHAPVLIAAATPLALGKGRAGAICFIWWTHRASLAAFRRAGWRRIGFSVELTTMRGRVYHLRLPLRRP